MNSAFLVWSAFHALALVGNLYKGRGKVSPQVPVTLISWMTWGAMLLTGHVGWFLWTNIPLLLLVALSGFLHLAKPPNSRNEEDASEALWSAALRLALVLTCWFLS